MDKYIEIALANQVCEMAINSRISSSHYNIYTQTKDGIKEGDAIAHLDLIRHIMQSGVSPLTIIEKYDKPKSLISCIFSLTQNNDILNIFIDSLKKEHIDSLDHRSIVRLYNNLDKESYSDAPEKFLKKIFELGFDFNQGTFDEAKKAKLGDQSFFELCMIHKSDFKFDFKYDGLFLDEIVKEEINSMDKNDSDYNKKENLMIFLKKSREVYELKKSLDSDLPSKEGNSVKTKI